MSESLDAQRLEVEPIIGRMISDVQNAFDIGSNRAIVVAPPATGKTTAAVRLAFRHMLTSQENLRYSPQRILYLGSNPISVQEQCERLATIVPWGDNSWDFAKEGTYSRIVGATYNQLTHLDLDPRIFSFVIADDAHHAMSYYPRTFLEHVTAPIVGLSNSMHHNEDLVARERRGTDLVLSVGRSRLHDFFGDPATRITYDDLGNLGVSRSVKIVTHEHEGSIRSHRDPRIVSIVDAYRRTVAAQGHCKTLIHVDTVEDANRVRRLLDEAFLADRNVVSPRIGTFHSHMTGADKAHVALNFRSGNIPIIIHCKTFDEGHVLDDLSLVVIAGKVRSAHGYERTVGRLFHSTSPHALVLDFDVRNVGHTNSSTYVDDGTIYFGTSGAPKKLHAGTHVTTPVWTRESAGQAIAQLHTRGYGKKEAIPTREQIDMAASAGLCPPTWVLFNEHGRKGFFTDSFDLAQELERLPNQYSYSQLNRTDVLAAIEREWRIDPSRDGLFSKKWLEAKCDGKTLPFRYRTIVGNENLFSTFTELTNALGMQGRYFRDSTQEAALVQIRKLYERQNGKPAIANPDKSLTIRMIRDGSIARMCPSEFKLFQHGHGNKPVFPGGIDDVNRALGFTLFVDMSKQDVLNAVKNLDEKAWPDRRFPVSQSEVNTAEEKGKLPFTTKHIIGKGKMWETKAEFDHDLGYQEPAFYYRSLRQQIRFGKEPPVLAIAQ